jgi:hypothetical protein
VDPDPLDLLLRTFPLQMNGSNAIAGPGPALATLSQKFGGSGERLSPMLSTVTTKRTAPALALGTDRASDVHSKRKVAEPTEGAIQIRFQSRPREQATQRLATDRLATNR